MEVLNLKDCEEIKIEKFPYRGKPLDVRGISVRWLSKAGEDDIVRVAAIFPADAGHGLLTIVGRRVRIAPPFECMFSRPGIDKGETDPDHSLTTR